MYLVRLILMCADAVNDFLGKNCQYMAGAIAFYTLFSMFPLVLAIVSIWGFFFPHEMEREIMAEQMAEIFPVSSDFIGETMRGVVSARTITGVASVFALIWASSAAFGAIRKGINAAWGVTRTRPFIRERLIDLGLASGAGILIEGARETDPQFFRHTENRQLFTRMLACPTIEELGETLDPILRGLLSRLVGKELPPALRGRQLARDHCLSYLEKRHLRDLQQSLVQTEAPNLAPSREVETPIRKINQRLRELESMRTG